MSRAGNRLMIITEVKIHLVGRGEPVAKTDPRVLATAKVRLDDKFYLNDIKICRTPNRICVEFVRNPYAVGTGHVEYTVVPVSMEARRWIEGIVLTAYLQKVRDMRRNFGKKESNAVQKE